MELARKFEELRQKARQRLSVGAQSESADGLATLVKISQECDEALATVQNLAQVAARISDQIDAPDLFNRTIVPLSTATVERKTMKRPGKADAKRARAEFILNAQKRGTPLVKVKRGIYRTKFGKLVGIAYANEDKRADLWWLGPPIEKLDVVVLLCQPRSGQRLEFVLPPEFVSRIRPVLSTNNDQVIFHVKRIGANFELTDSPETGVKNINQFLSRYEFLA